nr:Na/Pi symporter [uncultured Shimia sp.]
MRRNVGTGVFLVILVICFWAVPDLQEVVAGIAIFLFGMAMLEDGFKLFSGGLLETILERATASLPRALGFGFVTTTLMQSSSLVTLVTISFLSAGLITLTAGVGIIFGANIGTTTGAWLVAGFGLKVNLSAYAMPMLALAVVPAFQSSKYMRGFGLVLAGMGFLFLGIHYMKIGFDAFQSYFDLTEYALTGFAGLILFSGIGAIMTVIMQSSGATMVLVITALAASQITYENALALAIGSNIGTTITAAIGAISANYQGKRLALAHLIFNVATASVALVLIGPIISLVNVASSAIGISPDDYTLKLAVFHTLFNLMGVALMLPLLNKLISFLEHRIPTPTPMLAHPQFISEATDDFPETINIALQKELSHLLDSALPLIAGGLNLQWDRLTQSKNIPGQVMQSRTDMEFALGTKYIEQIKPIYSAIISFSARASGINDMTEAEVSRLHDLRDTASHISRAVKSTNRLHRNTLGYTVRNQGMITQLYDQLRIELADLMVQLDLLNTANADKSWLEQAQVQAQLTRKNAISQAEKYIRNTQIEAPMATSFINDTQYAYDVAHNLISAAQTLYLEPISIDHAASDAPQPTVHTS